MIHSCRSRPSSALCCSIRAQRLLCRSLQFCLYLCWSHLCCSLTIPWLFCLQCKFLEPTSCYACADSCTISTHSSYTLRACRHSLNPNNSIQRLFTWDVCCSLGYAFRNHTDVINSVTITSRDKVIR